MAIAAGELGAMAVLDRLREFAVSPQAYAAWREQHPRHRKPEAQIGFVAFEGSTVTNPARFAAQLESQPGQPFDPNRAERDARTLAAGGDYLRADYRLVNRDGTDGLIFDLEDKPWGPNYLRIGLDLSTDFEGRGTFNLKLSHNRHWLTPSGTEWRNRLQIGAVPLAFTELYHPLNWTSGPADDWFVAGYAGAERRNGALYDVQGAEMARFSSTQQQLGIDLGQPWGRFGEFRLGAEVRRLRASPTLVGRAALNVPVAYLSIERGLRLATVVDQLDFANFPSRGYRLVGELGYGENKSLGRYQRLEASALVASTFGAHTVTTFVLARGASTQQPDTIGRFALGGFQMLSGYRDDQLRGNYVLFGRLGWHMRLPYEPVVARAYFIGATGEVGNAWATRDDFRTGALRTGMSLYLGADTGVGPLYLAFTHAGRGNTGVVLFLGRP
jgi:NTE family protein